MPKSIELSFAELEAILADLHGIDSRKRIAFQARIKHFHREPLFFPDGVNAGKGRSNRYDVGQIVQLAIAMDLAQFGLTPERIVNLMREDMRPLTAAVGMAARSLSAQPAGLWEDEQAKSGPPSPMFLYIDPTALGPLMRGFGDDTGSDFFQDWASASFFYGGIGVIRERLEQYWHEFSPARRLALVNVTALLFHIAAALPADQRQRYLRQTGIWADIYQLAAAETAEAIAVLDDLQPTATLVDVIAHLSGWSKEEVDEAFAGIERNLPYDQFREMTAVQKPEDLVLPAGFAAALEKLSVAHGYRPTAMIETLPSRIWITEMLQAKLLDRLREEELWDERRQALVNAIGAEDDDGDRN